ncbi:unnamed protein product [Cyprideis torosa]|uniref:Uncharacterized protein n=1 Tax=Cyprideis torosa TaxID=163714 RepID=A0A7R8ZK91_9CRUS|nr:unnamed protein product [Cyprideis torosa]CAG0888784.1 unnamed protein product [Cyprideis torosa]
MSYFDCADSFGWLGQEVSIFDADPQPHEYPVYHVDSFDLGDLSSRRGFSGGSPFADRSGSEVSPAAGFLERSASPTSAIITHVIQPKKKAGTGLAVVGSKSQPAIQPTRKLPPPSTAFILWSEDIQRQWNEGTLHRDFSITTEESKAKYLADTWAALPPGEKHIWKNKSRRVQYKKNHEAKAKDAATGKITKSGSRFKTTGGAAKKPAAGRGAAASLKGTPIGKPSGPSRGGAISSGGIPSGPQFSQIPSPRLPVPFEVNWDLIEEKEALVPFPTGTSALDCAAQFNLMGENLQNIGERLLEHQGQLAISGSISLCLDTFLCCLAPLLPLINTVPGFEGTIDDETASRIMDYSHYFLPGL